MCPFKHVINSSKCCFSTSTMTKLCLQLEKHTSSTVFTPNTPVLFKTNIYLQLEALHSEPREQKPHMLSLTIHHRHPSCHVSLTPSPVWLHPRLTPWGHSEAPAPPQEPGLGREMSLSICPKRERKKAPSALRAVLTFCISPAQIRV